MHCKFDANSDQNLSSSFGPGFLPSMIAWPDFRSSTFFTWCTHLITIPSTLCRIAELSPINIWSFDRCSTQKNKDNMCRNIDLIWPNTYIQCQGLIEILGEWYVCIFKYLMVFCANGGDYNEIVYLSPVKKLFILKLHGRHIGLV